MTDVTEESYTLSRPGSVEQQISTALAELDLGDPGLSVGDVQAIVAQQLAGVPTTTSVNAAIASALAALPAIKQPRVAVNRIGVANGAASIGSSGGVGNATSRYAFAIPAGGCYDLEVTYDNFYIDGAGSGELVNGNPVTLKAGVEVGGTVIPLYLPNGSRSMTLDPGASLTALRCAIELPAGPAWIRTWESYTGTYVTVPYNSDSAVTSLGAANYGGYSQGDTVDTPGAMTNLTNNSGLWGPSCISAVLNVAQPVVAIIGDSLASGTGDTAVGGFLRRALGTIPHLLLGRASTAAYDTAPIHLHSRRFRRLTLCTDMFDEMGVNDIGAAKSLAETQANKLALWRAGKARGCRVWATTITPVNDNVGTSKETVRVGLNTWLRDGAPLTSAGAVAASGTSAAGTLRAGDATHPLAGYFEVADLAETARNSGLWKAGYSDDLKHPNPTGAAAIAPGVDISRLTAGYSTAA